jgi:hypothetical protein
MRWQFASASWRRPRSHVNSPVSEAPAASAAVPAATLRVTFVYGAPLT